MRILFTTNAKPNIYISREDISTTIISSIIIAETKGLRLLLEFGLNPNRRGGPGRTLFNILQNWASPPLF